MRPRRSTLLLLGLLAAAALGLGLATPIIPLLRYYRPPRRALVPVAGLRLARVDSSWGAARSGGRHHEGADLFAPRGTPALAATDGEVLRVGVNPLGGNVVWLVGEDATLFYYAHLDRFADRLVAGQTLRRGDTIGYVGTTGNAAHTSPHLHFGAYPLWNRFRPVDPVPLLRGWEAETLDRPGARSVP